jgi:hypothetical protein
MTTNLRDCVPRFCHRLLSPGSVARLWLGFVVRFCQVMSTVLRLGSRTFPNRTTHPSMQFSKHLHGPCNEMQHRGWPEICVASWIFTAMPCAPTLYILTHEAELTLTGYLDVPPTECFNYFANSFQPSLNITANLLLPQDETWRKLNKLVCTISQ